MITFTKTKQIGQKNLWFGVTTTGVRVLISYNTVVGRYNPATGFWELTKQKYSTTTSRQLTQFSREYLSICVDNFSEGFHGN